MKTTEAAVIFIIGTLTLFVFVLFVVLIIIEYRKRQVRHLTEKLEMKHQYQNEVLQTRIEVQEQSLKYFSEEVHDNIAQMLSLVKLKLYKVAGKTADDTIRAGIESSTELLGQTLDDLRRLSHVMNGSLVSKIPLAESVEKELDYVRSVGDIDARLMITGLLYELTPEKKLLAFRIIQEAVGNAVRHGRAREINISLAYEPRLLVIHITDNGTGFDTKLVNESAGLGLHNMQVRAKLLGDIKVTSETGKGTTITLTIKTNE